ncbi:MAG: hypothetical protein IJN48_00760 [Clostridia bacterium]|nr:hypothetical protein [Clostridia bacterium]
MKKKKVISFGLLLTAFLFFSNPNINIIDVLPDCIACLLIAFAISKLGDMCEDLAAAKHAFYTLFWITVSKGPAFILLLWIVGANMNESTMWLLFSFCYAVAEAVFAIRAFNALFGGLAYLGSRNEGGDFIFIPTVKETEKNVGNRRFDALKLLTTVFIIVKSAMFTLPEFVYIYPQDEINISAFNIVNFRPHFIVLGALVAAFAGIVWLVMMCRYVAHLSKHKDFWEQMRLKYEEKVLPRQGLFIMRYTRVFTLIVTAALFFSVDLYIDEYNMLPDFISAILFFVAACVIGKYAGTSRALKISSVVYFLTAAVTFVAMIYFKTDGFSTIGYYYRNVYANDNAARLYMIYAVSNAVTQVAFLSVVFSLCALLMRMVRMHTGINTLTGVSNSSRPLEKVYQSRINRIRALSVVTAVMSVLYFYLIVYFERTETQIGYSYMPKFAIIWMIDFIVATAFAIHASNVASDLSGEVVYKYKYE